MTPDVNATSGSIPCWNCEQSLPIGSQRCLFCGVPQEARSAQFVLAPHGVLGAAPPPSVPLSPGEAMPAAIGFMTPAMAAAPTSPLGAAFAGSPAGVGVRLAALTIDVIVIAVVSAAAALLLRSVTLTAIIAAELGVGLIVLQARTGLGIGGALLRIRVAKVDAPFSPGISQALLRALVGGAGGLLLVVGAWLIELTAAFDSSGRRRSWADLAARTVVVAVPRRTAVSARLVGPRATVPLSVPVSVPVLLPLPIPLSVPAVQSAPVAQPVLAAHPPAVTPVPALQPPRPQEAPRIAPLLIVPLPPTSLAPAQLLTPQPITPLPAPVEAPAPTRGLVPPTLRTVTPTFPHADTGSQSITSAGAPAEAPVLLPVVQPSQTQPNPGSSAVSGGGELLLVFDTGQREQLPIPVSVNLGRNPAATDPGDVLIVVRDPESTVSKTHVRLEVARGGTWVTDTGSTNGTDLLDEDGTATQLAVGVRTSVEDGVRIRLGNRAFTIGRLMDDAQ